MNTSIEWNVKSDREARALNDWREENLGKARTLLARPMPTWDGTDYLDMMVTLEWTTPALADDPSAHGTVPAGPDMEAARLYGALQDRFNDWCLTYEGQIWLETP